MPTPPKLTTNLILNNEEHGLIIPPLKSFEVKAITAFIHDYDSMVLKVNSSNVQNKGLFTNAKNENKVTRLLQQTIVYELEDLREAHNTNDATTNSSNNQQTNKITIDSITSEQILKYLRDKIKAIPNTSIHTKSLNTECRNGLEAIKLTLTGDFRADVNMYVSKFTEIMTLHGEPAELKGQLPIFFWRNIPYGLRKALILKVLSVESKIDNTTLKNLLTDIDTCRKFLIKILKETFDNCFEFGVLSPWKHLNTEAVLDDEKQRAKARDARLKDILEYRRQKDDDDESSKKRKNAWSDSNSTNQLKENFGKENNSNNNASNSNKRQKLNPKPEDPNNGAGQPNFSQIIAQQNKHDWACQQCGDTSGKHCSRNCSSRCPWCKQEHDKCKGAFDCRWRPNNYGSTTAERAYNPADASKLMDYHLKTMKPPPPLPSLPSNNPSGFTNKNNSNKHNNHNKGVKVQFKALGIPGNQFEGKITRGGKRLFVNVIIDQGSEVNACDPSLAEAMKTSFGTEIKELLEPIEAELADSSTIPLTKGITIDTCKLNINFSNYNLNNIDCLLLPEKEYNKKDLPTLIIGNELIKKMGVDVIKKLGETRKEVSIDATPEPAELPIANHRYKRNIEQTRQLKAMLLNHNSELAEVLDVDEEEEEIDIYTRLDEID